ncbi:MULTISPECIES: M28 family peptidase [Massilia]|uniref:M28 family peptidase n=2 Tax=Massilia TaxID=149698 RepID=A0A7X3G6L9_9BURK|nr:MULTISPECIES: M28 family peptidase [Telluria group]KQY08542.1 aminopeptidase [Massilia sp. Root133]KQZ49175.1 aminopeptidase [Massilia sp. Root1485]MDN4045928.1 M28 family peptidase [Massilia sp. YIM B02787]MVW64420.1 M28 family peptidase [Telluria cellulosilytica]
MHPVHKTALPILLLLGAGAHAAPLTDATLPARQADVDTIVREISPQRIHAYVEKLVSFGTRHTMSDTASDTRGIGAARRWIRAELERCGAGKLDVQFQSHVHPVANRITRPTEIVNVVATLPGTQPASKDRYYVVSGHYDSRVTDVMNATADAPGANDDASGTAAVIEMACVMSRHKFDASLVFMTVAAEEQGLYGSGDYAAKAKAAGMNIAGMLNNDIIGSSHDENGKLDNAEVRLFAEGVPPVKETTPALRTLLQTGGENDSITRQLARHVKETGERYVPNFKVNIIYRRDRYLRGGDHSPFLDAGYAAVRFTEPHEDFNHQHQDLRTENGKKIGDLVEYVDPDYVAQVARVNAAALASLALAPAAPQDVKVKTANLDNGTDLVWKANAEPDLAGYRIVWRDTTAAQWQGSKFVGNVTTYRVDLSKDNLLFGVQAVDKDGNVSPATYPFPAR